CLCLFFFFSSRRRHTRFSRDWSSDVCSSDLLEGGVAETVVSGALLRVFQALIGGADRLETRFRIRAAGILVRVVAHRELAIGRQIGRASCRERVWISVRGVAVERYDSVDGKR